MPKDCKKNGRVKRDITPYISSPSRMQGFRMAMTGKQEPPLPGMIRMLAPVSLPSVLYTHFCSFDRSLTEWIGFLNSYVCYGLPQKPWKIADRYNPLFHWKTTGELYQAEFERQMRIRFIIKKWVSRCKVRIYQKRLIGETDLRTMEPIKPSDAIRIVSISGKCVYQFHIHTLIRMIRENLHYEQWGLAKPMMPRNPYTNLPWTQGQIMELIRQIHQVCTSRGAVVPSFIAKYAEANYCTVKFFKQNRLELGMEATYRFFSSPDSSGTREDLLDQLYDQITYVIHKRPIFRMIRRKKLPVHLQADWDQLLQNLWIHTNYGYSPKFMWRDMIEQTGSAEALFIRTNFWYVMHHAPPAQSSAQNESTEEEENDSE